MLHPLTSVTTTPTAVTMPSLKPKRVPSAGSSPSSSLCRHSPSATLDILILILVLFSCAFLIVSYLTYVFQSLSRIFPSHLSSFNQNRVFYIAGFLIFASLSIAAVEVRSSHRSRKCDKPGCKGLKNAMEFDIKLDTEDSLRDAKSKDIDGLPWKGGTALNPDYECLRSELRKMAPPNGRAILLFRDKCGCPVAKLEAWAAKRARRQKKAPGDLLVKGTGIKR